MPQPTSTYSYSSRGFLTAVSVSAIAISSSLTRRIVIAAVKDDRTPMPDIIVVIPGIMGSVLQVNGKEVWGGSPKTILKAIFSRGESIESLRMSGDDLDRNDLEDGVRAVGLFPTAQLIPGFLRLEGYTKLTQWIKAKYKVSEGLNYFEFPYDWRRDIRVAARQLQYSTHTWLKAWRESTSPNARLIIIAHSMGGLVARYFLERLDGWRDTRHLFTFGTPFRGSPKALKFLSDGFPKSIAGVRTADLSGPALLRWLRY